MSTDSQKVEVLFKKYLGAGDAYPGLSEDQDVPVNARPKIIPSLQILSQAIPSVAPTDLVLDGGYSGGGQRYTSSAYPHIVKYSNLTSASLKPGFSYR